MTKQSRASKAHIPRTFQAWDKEVRGIAAFLSNYETFICGHGKKWFNKTADYKVERLEFLLKNHPTLPDGYEFPSIRGFKEYRRANKNLI